MYKIAIAVAAIVLLIPLAGHSFASNIEIDIHTGSADQNQHLTFYTAATSAYVGDVLQFGNGDTVSHEVVSGTPDAGPSGKFDSGTINPGQYFTYTLTEYDVGTFTFYDKTYPWMTGSLVVQEAPGGYKVLHNVGADAGDGKTTFDVQYQSVKNIISANIGAKDKSLNLMLVGQTTSNSDLVLRLPTGLITPPFFGVQLDGQFTKNFTVSNEQGIEVVTIPITPVTEQVSIVGTQVVPEFGPIAMMILAAAVITLVVLTRITPIRKLG
ncbi:MAG: PEFG-CTERM sorting domain-containing protein [Thaumarchaeota archaeon]|nr:PEFG-CTERM sorting domain-containing protein [Nitrososphaerota archaeon]